MALILYATAHQDDETLLMGSSIRAHLEAGHDVCVLLFTTGENSGVRDQLGMDRPTFTAARDDELVRACRRLGVRFEHVHIDPDRTQDGQLTVEAAQTMLGAWVGGNTDPGGPPVWVKTYSNLAATGRHPDHINLGQAAVNLLHAGVIIPNGLRSYVEPWLRSAFETANPGVRLLTDQAANLAIVRAGLDEYGAEDGIGGKYGIGHRSVKSAFDLVRATPVSYYHVPAAT